MRAGDWLQGVRAVVFDAVGTLIAPDPPAPAVYTEVGRRHGSRLDPETIRERFRDAFRQEEMRDRLLGWRTNDEREEQRWRSIVAVVLDDVADPEACFRELWDHFARPSAWRVLPGVGPVLAELARRGFGLGIASNFDGRLRPVVAGLPELTPAGPLTISAEVGWRKPGRPFFDAAVRSVGCAPGDVLLVGDDFENDYAGAMAAGLRAVYLDVRSEARPGVAAIGGLAGLL